jgi:hypothetical protein
MGDWQLRKLILSNSDEFAKHASSIVERRAHGAVLSSGEKRFLDIMKQGVANMSLWLDISYVAQ